MSRRLILSYDEISLSRVKRHFVFVPRALYDSQNLFSNCFHRMFSPYPLHANYLFITRVTLSSVYFTTKKENLTANVYASEE